MVLVLVANPCALEIYHMSHHCIQKLKRLYTCTKSWVIMGQHSGRCKNRHSMREVLLWVHMSCGETKACGGKTK